MKRFLELTLHNENKISIDCDKISSVAEAKTDDAVSQVVIDTHIGTANCYSVKEEYSEIIKMLKGDK